MAIQNQHQMQFTTDTAITLERLAIKPSYNNVDFKEVFEIIVNSEIRLYNVYFEQGRAIRAFWRDDDNKKVYLSFQEIGRELSAQRTILDNVNQFMCDVRSFRILEKQGAKK